jgi:hypothetical protein
MLALSRERNSRSVLFRGRIHVPARLARARIERTVEALEHGREIGLDALQREELLVELVIATFAEPDEAVLFLRQALAFDHEPDRIRHPLR